MDETPRQLISETREPVPAAPGRPAREDYEYRRCGSCNVFMATEPLAGRRMTKVTARRTKTDWAHFLNDIAGRHRGAKRITLVMDNLNTHRPGALYEAFPPAEAKALWDRFEFVYTPKHGSWLPESVLDLPAGVRVWTDPGIAWPGEQHNRAPTGRPLVNGTARVGETLTASAAPVSDPDGLANAEFAWQWLSSDGTGYRAIAGAVGPAYTLTPEDEGKTIKARLTLTDDGGGGGSALDTVRERPSGA